MADIASATPSATPATTTPKKSKAAAKPKAKKTVPSHPKTSDMVNAAIANLKERGGSSLQAIKKYIASNYKVDVEKLAPFIRKYLKSAVTNGTLVQKKGKGASGSFGLNPNQKTEKKAKKPAAAKKAATGEKKVKKPAAKKAAGEKKAKPSAAKKAKKSPAKPKKAPAAKKAAKPKKAKTPKKAKSPKKPKSPKPKKAPAAKKAKKN